MGWYAWRRRDVPGAAALVGLLLPVTVWLLASGLSATGHSPTAAYFWQRVSFSAITVIPTAGLLFILQFTGRADRLTRSRRAALLAFPLLTLLMIWTNPLHHGFVRAYTFDWADGGMTLTAWEGGWWFPLHTAYNFVVAAVAIGIAGWGALRAPQPFRGQLTVIFLWYCLSIVFTILLTAFPYRLVVALVPLLPVLNSLGFAWAVFRLRFFDLSPVARDLLVETMDDGMLALDARDRVVDANRALETLTGLTRAALIGQPLADLPAPWKDLVQRTEIILGQGRHLHVHITLLMDRRRRPRGRLILLHDITALKWMETLETRVAARTRDLSTLYQVASLIGRGLDLPDVLQGCLTRLVEANGSAAGVILLQASGATFQAAATTWGEWPPLALADDGWRQIAAADETLLVHDLTASPWGARLFDGRSPFPSLAAAPLQVGAQRGVLALLGPRPAQFNVEDLGLLTTVAEQVGVAIENDHLRRQQQAAAVSGERQRLARDLHDSVTQLLYSQVLLTHAAQKALATGAPGRAADFLARLEGAARQSLREMRLLIYQLRPADLAKTGLVETLRRRLEMVEQRAEVAAYLQADDGLTLPAEWEEGVYYIAEEALNNALKHAAASQVTVALRRSQSGLELEIADNGCGFDPATVRAGLGLTGMGERAALLGGELNLASAPGHGTCLLLRLPPIR